MVQFNQQNFSSLIRYDYFCEVFNFGYNQTEYPVEILRTPVPGYNGGVYLILRPIQNRTIEISIYNYSMAANINKVSIT